MIKVRYCFKEDETERLISRFGKDFYEKVARDIETYADRWKLSGFQFLHSYSINCVFICHSELYGDAVLKIGKPSKQVLTEYNTLREYDGRRFCKAFDSDIENGIIIEERIQPGRTLWEESSLDKRLSIFCSLYEGLHIVPAKADIYPTYKEWVRRITDYMSRRQDGKALYLHMKKAEELYSAISAVYSKNMLLHGDIHPENMLLGNNNEYILIDPKGVVGDPVFDIAHYILNEFDDAISNELYQKISDIIDFLETKLRIPNDIIRKCLYIQTAMAECWEVEDGSNPSLDRVAFAETFLRN